VSSIEVAAEDFGKVLVQLLDRINRTKEDSQALNLHPACRSMRRQPDPRPAAATAAGRLADRSGESAPGLSAA
jgi:hypothetical protein